MVSFTISYSQPLLANTPTRVGPDGSASWAEASKLFEFVAFESATLSVSAIGNPGLLACCVSEWGDKLELDDILARPQALMAHSSASFPAVLTLKASPAGYGRLYKGVNLGNGPPGFNVYAQVPEKSAANLQSRLHVVFHLRGSGLSPAFADSGDTEGTTSANSGGA
jgi:hypothetical protein